MFNMFNLGILHKQDGLHEYTGLALKHITTGHLVAQIATLAFSNYASWLHFEATGVVPHTDCGLHRIVP